MAKPIQNTQNIPRDSYYKNLFIPLRDGDILLEGDLSQAEGMVVAWKAEETILMDKYSKGEDVHTFVGQIVMEKTNISKEERDIAKRIVHGSNYGMSPIKMAQIILNETGLVINSQECRRKQNIYFQNFPRIRSVYQAEIKNELNTTLNHIKTLNGWNRKFFTPKGNELFRQAYAHYPQNIVAFITNTALNKLVDWGWKDCLYAQNHDAILLTVPEDRINNAVNSLKKAMTQPILIKGRELIIPVELKKGKKWGTMEKVK